MKDWTWKNWLGLVIVLFGAWLGVYILYWLDRNECIVRVPLCLANAAGNWIGDVTMLKWVKSHQTLVGGIITGIGAFSGLIALYVQKGWQRRDEIKKRRQDAINALNWTHLLFKSCSESALRNSTEDLRRDMEQLRRHVEPLAEISAGTADLVRLSISSFEHWLSRPADLFWIETHDGAGHLEWNVMTYISVMSSLWAAFFADAPRLVDDQGNYQFKVQHAVAARHALWRYDKVSYKKLPFMMSLFE